MAEKLTTSQIQRLKELNADEQILDKSFENKKQCDDFYREKEIELAKENKTKISQLVNDVHRPTNCKVEEDMVKWLTEKEHFTQVTTPIILPKTMLEKMTITEEHHLTSQVFWLDSKKCLRPMLAPNLYLMMKDIHKVMNQPVRIFECGPCFRKETQGAQHMNEFTMLNFVELAGVKDGEQMDRLKELAVAAMKAIGIDHYEMEIAESEVYGETLDIVCEGIELASGAYGPHVLDSKWGIFDTWVGMGFGIERIAMILGGYKNIKRVGRSLSYIDGARLNI